MACHIMLEYSGGNGGHPGDESMAAHLVFSYMIMLRAEEGVDV
jgi:hypothetical protein